jgi:hypothetical protein
MKKITLLLVAFLFVLSHSFSQSCLPEGITFRFQADIDNFHINYPGCTQIEGDVTIGNDGYLTDNSSLNGLNMLTAIGGSLYINTNENLSSFAGLDALETIGGDFIVKENVGLTDFSGLETLTNIQGKFYVVENNNLISFSGLGALTSIDGVFEMGHNLIFSEFSGLSSLTSTGGLSFSYLTNIQSLDGLNILTSIDGDFYITSCNTLINLAGMNNLTTISGRLSLSDNLIIETLLGLEALTYVGGDFQLYNNEKISSLAALANLTEVGGSLILKGCDMMPSLTGLQALTSVSGELEIGGNEQLTSLEGIENINPQSITNLEISYNPVLSECVVQSICDYLQNPGGQVFLAGNAAGCSSEDEVATGCTTGIDDAASQILFSLYPNPANKEFSIEIQNDLKIQAILIYDLLGRLVLAVNPTNNQVVVSSLDKGMYFLKVETDRGQASQNLMIE